MKTMPTVISVVALGIAIIGGVWIALSYWGIPKALPSITEPDTSKTFPEATGTEQIKPASRPTPEPAKDNAAATAAAMENPDGHQSEVFIQAALQLNVPIAFYGKVVDQNDDPIEGATVSLRWREVVKIRSDMSTTQDEPVATTTDLDGQFELTGKIGTAVLVEDVEKDDYEFTLTGKHFFEYKEGMPAPDPANPVLFTIWKQQGAEQLIVHEERFKLVPGGQYTLDFLAGTKSEGVQPDGDVILNVQRPQVLEPRKRIAWSFTLDGVGGGIVEASPEYPNLAPESGYSPHYEWLMEPDEPDYTEDLRKEFFVLSRDKKIYSRIQLHINPRFNDKVYLSIKTFVNPTGSRNLEYDPRQFTSSQ